MPEPLAVGTLAILAVTAVWSWQGFRSPGFTERFIFSPAPILREQQYYRLVTSGLLHADWVHFAVNAFSLYCFGRLLELDRGFATLAAIYFGAIVGGGLLSLFIHRRQEYRALGASGGVCGVIFASIFLQPGVGIVLFPLPISIPSWLYAILFLVGSFVALRRQADNVGHAAHLGGAVIGLLITTVLYPAIIVRHPRLYATVLGLAVGLFAYLWFNPVGSQAIHPLAHWRETLAERRRRAAEASRLDDEQEMDRLLEKISQGGLDSLSRSERQRLERISRRK